MEVIFKDMGCDKKMAERIATMQNQGNIEGILRILVEHRQQLLNTVHKCEKQISCLDYYLYCLKKEANKK